MKTYEYILSATILLVSICGCARKSAVATAADESRCFWQFDRYRREDIH